MKTIKNLRWWIIGLIMVGSCINFLARSSIAVAAPTIIHDLQMTTQQYAYVVSAFQLSMMAMPATGYIMDAIGLKIGFAIFCIAWSLLLMAHGLVHSWQGLAVMRAFLGLPEGSANPAGMKAVTEWFPAKERGLANGVYNIGASFGSMIAPPLVAWSILAYSWQFAFVLIGLLGLVWVVAWLCLYSAPGKNRSLSVEERNYINSGRDPTPSEAVARPSIMRIISQRNFWGIALPRFLADPTWGTLSFWVPLYLSTTRHMDLKEIALFAWLPFLAADAGSIFSGVAVTKLLRWTDITIVNARRCVFTIGAVLMLGMPFVGWVVSPYAAVALMCLGGFAHQTLSLSVITMSSDLFDRGEVATATGCAGSVGIFGSFLFQLSIGLLVASIGYEPFFVVLAMLDIVGAIVLWSFVRDPAGLKARPPVASPA